MKFIATITQSMGVAALLAGAALAQPEFNLNEINTRIDAIVARKGHIKETTLALDTRAADADFQFLRLQCETHWAQIFQNFDAIHHGVDGQVLVVETLTEISASDFMSVFEALVVKFEAETLDKKVIRASMGYFMGRLRAFFRDNYQHPRVIAALNKVKAKVGNDQNFVDYINGILSGEAKVNLDIYREAHEGVLGEDIPIIMLPSE